MAAVYATDGTFQAQLTSVQRKSLTMSNAGVASVVLKDPEFVG